MEKCQEKYAKLKAKKKKISKFSFIKLVKVSHHRASPTGIQRQTKWKQGSVLGDYKQKQLETSILKGHSEYH